MITLADLQPRTTGIDLAAFVAASEAPPAPRVADREVCPTCGVPWMIVRRGLFVAAHAIDCPAMELELRRDYRCATTPPRKPRSSAALASELLTKEFELRPRGSAAAFLATTPPPMPPRRGGISLKDLL